MFIIRNKNTKEVIRKSDTPLRTDGKLPADMDPDIELLAEVWEREPSYTKTTHKLEQAIREAAAADEPIKLIYGWAIVPLTQEELDFAVEQANLRGERQQVKALMAALKAGTGTAGERITRVEKGLHLLLKENLRDL